MDCKTKTTLKDVGKSEVLLSSNKPALFWIGTADQPLEKTFVLFLALLFGNKIGLEKSTFFIS